MSPKKVGIFLKSKRLANNITVTDITQQINRSKSYYYNLEAGKARVDALVLKRILELYNDK